MIDEPRIDVTPNCGNILAGVGPFALERGLVAAQDPVTRVRVHTVNTGTVSELKVQTPDGRVAYGARPDRRRSGTAAPIAVEFLDAAGSVCGSSRCRPGAVDQVAGVDATLIDNGMPVVVLEALAVGRTGYEPRDVLDKDMELAEARGDPPRSRQADGPRRRLQEGRAQDLSRRRLRAAICMPRSFIPHECHASIGVFAVTVATTCVLPGSPAARVARVPPGREKTLSVEHPTGEFSVMIEVGGTPENPVVERAGLIRTARLLFEGFAYAREDVAFARRPQCSLRFQPTLAMRCP